MTIRVWPVEGHEVRHHASGRVIRRSYMVPRIPHYTAAITAGHLTVDEAVGRPYAERLAADKAAAEKAAAKAAEKAAKAGPDPGPVVVADPPKDTPAKG